MPTASLNGSYLTAEMRLTGRLSEPVRKMATSPLMEPPAAFARRTCGPPRLSRKWRAGWLLLGMASLLLVTWHGDRSTRGRPRVCGTPVRFAGARDEPHRAAPGRVDRAVGADGPGRARCRGDASRRGSSRARHGHASTRVEPLTLPPACHAIEALVAVDFPMGPDSCKARTDARATRRRRVPDGPRAARPRAAARAAPPGQPVRPPLGRSAGGRGRGPDRRGAPPPGEAHRPRARGRAVRRHPPHDRRPSSLASGRRAPAGSGGARGARLPGRDADPHRGRDPAPGVDSPGAGRRGARRPRPRRSRRHGRDAPPSSPAPCPGSGTRSAAPSRTRACWTASATPTRTRSCTEPASRR